jgi:hypothetical protein
VWPRVSSPAFYEPESLLPRLQELSNCTYPETDQYSSHSTSYLYRIHLSLRFYVLAAVTMKNAVFWYITPFGSCKNRRFGGAYRLHHKGDRDRRDRYNVSNN